MSNGLGQFFENLRNLSCRITIRRAGDTEKKEIRRSIWQTKKTPPVEERRLEKEQIEDMGSVYRTKGAHAIHCLTVIGQIEGPRGSAAGPEDHQI